LSPQTKEALGKLLFAEAIVSNPVDVVATAGPEQYGGTVETLLQDPNIDSLLLNFVTPPFVDCQGVARKLAEVAKKAAKPVVCVVMTIEKWADVVRLIRESGIPVYDFPETASRVLAFMADYSRIVNKEAPFYKQYEVDKDGAEAILSRYRDQEKFLPQNEVFEVLRHYGIPTAVVMRIKGQEELEEAAAKIGYPLVLKVEAETIIHKTEVGGVALNLKDEAALSNAFQEMSKKFEKENPSFILQEYMEGGKEVIIGAKSNQGLQPTIMFGLGGVFVETLKDVQFGLAPLSEQEAWEMIRSIKGYPLLKGIRGEKAVDCHKLAEILIRFSQLASDFPEIDEMDLNPVIALEEGKGAVIVDARLKVKKENI